MKMSNWGLESIIFKVHCNSFGSNTRRVPKVRTICELILDILSDKILVILLVAAVFSTVLGIVQDGLSSGWIDGLSILIAVAAIVIITASNNLVKEK